MIRGPHPYVFCLDSQNPTHASGLFGGKFFRQSSMIKTWIWNHSPWTQPNHSAHFWIQPTSLKMFARTNRRYGSLQPQSTERYRWIVQQTHIVLAIGGTIKRWFDKDLDISCNKVYTFEQSNTKLNIVYFDLYQHHLKRWTFGHFTKRWLRWRSRNTQFSLLCFSHVNGAFLNVQSVRMNGCDETRWYGLSNRTRFREHKKVCLVRTLL